MIPACIQALGKFRQKGCDFEVSLDGVYAMFQASLGATGRSQLKPSKVRFLCPTSLSLPDGEAVQEDRDLYTFDSCTPLTKLCILTTILSRNQAHTFRQCLPRFL